MIHRLWPILFLLIIWCGFSNNFQVANILLGLIFSAVIFYLVIPKQLNFNVNIVQLMVLGCYIIWELFWSSIEVAWNILKPTYKNHSKIIKVPLHCQHPVQISLLVNLISLTPGTLVIDIENKNTLLLIHIMFAKNEEKIITFIKDQLEPKIVKVIQYG